MSELRYTLLTDGSSDRALIPILDWTLRANGVRLAINGEWADLRRLRNPPRGLEERIRRAIELYPCDLLFVHRDAEREPLGQRVGEIERALEAAEVIEIACVSVVPVRMQEAWLLFDEQAIRRAAGNPNGNVLLNLPRPRDVEDLPDPKRALVDLIRQASELQGRRLERLNVRERIIRVADCIDDFSPLRDLPAFLAMEETLSRIIREHEWA